MTNLTFNPNGSGISGMFPQFVDPTANNTPIISDACIQWAETEHFRFEHNEIISSIFLVIMASVFMNLALYVIDRGHRHIPWFQGEHGDDNKFKVAKGFFAAAKWCHWLFLGWIVYQIYYGFLQF